MMSMSGKVHSTMPSCPELLFPNTCDTVAKDFFHCNVVKVGECVYAPFVQPALKEKPFMCMFKDICVVNPVKLFLDLKSKEHKALDFLMKTYTLKI